MSGRGRREHPARTHLVPASSFAALLPDRITRGRPLLPAGLQPGLVLGEPGVPVEVFVAGRTVRGAVVGPFDLITHVVRRALSAGASATVRTADPMAWGDFSDQVALPRERLSFRPSDAEVRVRATASRPHLLLDHVPPGGTAAVTLPADSLSGWTLHLVHHAAMPQHLPAADLLLAHTGVLGPPGRRTAPAGYAELDEPERARRPGEELVALLTAEAAAWTAITATVA